MAVVIALKLLLLLLLPVRVVFLSVSVSTAAVLPLAVSSVVPAMPTPLVVVVRLAIFIDVFTIRVAAVLA